jgi:hypothetical protein
MGTMDKTIKKHKRILKYFDELRIEEELKNFKLLNKNLVFRKYNLKYNPKWLQDNLGSHINLIIFILWKT